MSYDFFRRDKVKAKKAHQCEHCRSEISVGLSHYYCAGKFEGDFASYREHEECFEAWQKVHSELRPDSRWDDSHPFLVDDDFDKGERDWLSKSFPLVASRLWPSEYGEAA